jgi:hypothetical protein
MPSKYSLEWRIGEARKWLVGGKLLTAKPGQANNYNDQANVGYGKYGSKLRRLLFRIIIRLRVMLKELFTELVLNMKNRISDQQWSINDMGMTLV